MKETIPLKDGSCVCFEVKKLFENLQKTIVAVPCTAFDGDLTSWQVKNAFCKYTRVV